MDGSGKNDALRLEALGIAGRRRIGRGARGLRIARHLDMAVERHGAEFSTRTASVGEPEELQPEAGRERLAPDPPGPRHPVVAPLVDAHVDRENDHEGDGYRPTRLARSITLRSAAARLVDRIGFAPAMLSVLRSTCRRGTPVGPPGATRRVPGGRARLGRRIAIGQVHRDGELREPGLYPPARRAASQAPSLRPRGISPAPGSRAVGSSQRPERSGPGAERTVRPSGPNRWQASGGIWTRNRSPAATGTSPPLRTVSGPASVSTCR